MQLQYIKFATAAMWLIMVVVVGEVFGLTSSGGRIALAVVALLPPALMFRFWNDPPQTMSENIREGRR